MTLPVWLLTTTGVLGLAALVTYAVVANLGACNQPLEHRVRRQIIDQPQPALQAPSPRQEPNINETCSICIERIGRELHSRLQCNHIFHKKCIDNWSKHDNTSHKCPNCRSQEL